MDKAEIEICLADELKRAKDSYQHALNRFNALPSNSPYTDLIILELQKAELEMQIALTRAKIAQQLEYQHLM